MEATQELLAMVDQTTKAKQRLIKAKQANLLRTISLWALTDLLLVSDEKQRQDLEEIRKGLGYFQRVLLRD